jgi:hypothetical protein
MVREMANAKTAMLTFRVDPDLKQALHSAAQQEHRSIANMVEVLIRDYCARNEIAVPNSNAGQESEQGSSIEE